LSSPTLAEQISAIFADSSLLIVKRGNEERAATLQDLREALIPLGYDITTIDAVNWEAKYPGEASDITRICELQQQITDLEHRLKELLQPPPELKRAAE
jgi:hypothetical protein